MGKKSMSDNLGLGIFHGHSLGFTDGSPPRTPVRPLGVVDLKSDVTYDSLLLVGLWSLDSVFPSSVLFGIRS